MTTGELTAAPAAPAAPVARVHVPARSLRGDVRAVKIVWQRELIRFSRDRMRIVTSLVPRCCSCSCWAPGSSGSRAPARTAST